MRIILLSGGSGKRLWPISNDFRAKQFLRVLADGQGNRESMIQRVWRQLKTAGLSESAIIATGQEQVDIIQNQLGDLTKMVIEPKRRDTYPAIALAASYLFSLEHLRTDQVITVIRADCFVEDAFFQLLKEIEGVLTEANAELGLVGVMPTYPSDKYGYIVPVPKQAGDRFINVGYFRAKPTEKEAEELIMRQALWNCGVFAFKPEYIISKLEEAGLPTEYWDLRNKFDELPQKSFDNQIAESANSAIALRYEGEWRDFGTWSNITEKVASPVLGKGYLSGNSYNTNLINELDLPVIVLGVANAVIAASPDGILVAEKKECTRVIDLVNCFLERPMFEERRWGWYRVLEHTKYENAEEVLVKHIKITAGKSLSYQLHHHRNEVWQIIGGVGQFALDDVISCVKSGDVLQIPVGVKHGIIAETDLELIEIQSGRKLEEDDIERVFMTWQDVAKHCGGRQEHSI